MARLSLSLLGSFQASLDQSPITAFRYDKARALLAYLAVEADRPHRRESLAGLFWPERSERSARRSLSHALTILRGAVGDRGAGPCEASENPFLLISRETIQFNNESDHWLDVQAFSDTVRGEPTAEQVERAIALYRGDFLEGFSIRDSPAFEDWAVLVRERLCRQVSAALARLADHYEAGGERARACDCARRRVEMEPLEEEAHRQLMRLFALSGRRGDALAQYEACRRLLAAELSVQPAEETTRLYQRIRDGQVEPHSADTVVAEDRAPTNLPVPLIPLVGRELELAEIVSRLRDPTCRILILVGPGGSGKTRLAIEAAKRAAAEFSDGAHFVPLAPLASADAIVPTIAQVLGFTFYGGAGPGARPALAQQLLAYLRKKRMLLVLDNFEHLLDGAGQMADILREALEVKVLVTTRARLNLSGEQLFPVSGMHYPEAAPVAIPAMIDDPSGCSAVALFLEGASRARPNFAATVQDLEAVVEICRLVRGIPLAILLAASWMEVLSPAEIAQRVRAQSLDFLAAEWRDIPERQRSMRAVFDHSWRLLSDRERKALGALSAFRGGFTEAAAGQVASARMRDLMRLANRSLLHREASGRYEMHELLRQYATERLEADAPSAKDARDRHAAFYAEALQRWELGLKGSRQVATLEEMDGEIENARAAWRWAAERGRLDWLDRGADGLGLYHDYRHRCQEGAEIFRMAVVALERTPECKGNETACAARVLATLKAWQGAMSERMGQRQSAHQLLEEALGLLASPNLAGPEVIRAKAFVLLQLALEAKQRDSDECGRAAERSLSLYRNLGDQWGIATALPELGWATVLSGAYKRARRLAEESLAIRRALGDRTGMLSTLVLLCFLAGQRGLLDEQERFAREHLAISRELGDRALIAYGLHLLGNVQALQGRYSEACSTLREALATQSDLGIPELWARLTHSLAAKEMHAGHYEDARGHFHEALHASREIDWLAMVGQCRVLLGCEAMVRGDHEESQRWLRQGFSTFEQSSYHGGDFGTALALLACPVYRLDQPLQARQYLRDALRIAVETKTLNPAGVALATQAMILAEQNEVEQAVELYALVSREARVANSRWFQDVFGREIAAAAATLPPEVAAAARERGRARDLWATVAEVLEELRG